MPHFTVSMKESSTEKSTRDNVAGAGAWTDMQDGHGRIKPAEFELNEEAAIGRGGTVSILEISRTSSPTIQPKGGKKPSYLAVTTDNGFSEVGISRPKFYGASD